ncbi:tetratricopeptide repeat protein, partial [Candidatus Bipolaricaulota bacterium]|nr:tetratricopeptide repeat protein [Candidatus Bipolaricaulota bacterium]
IWERNSGRTRELDWWIGWEMLKARPITGIGLGNYKLAFLPYKASFLSTPRGNAYIDLKIPRAGQAHSDYVQAVAELGGLGLLAMIAFFAVLAVSIWKRIRRSADEADRLDLLLFTGGLIVFLVHALVSFPAHLASSAMVVVVVLGLIHAPAYGDACIRGFHMRRLSVTIALGAVSVLGIVVSAFAISDLAANALMGAGIQQLQIGDPSAARQIFERSITLDFAPRQTYYYLATAQVQLGETEDALSNYEKCFTRFVDENTYLVFADLAASANRLEEARAAVQFLLSTNPKRSIELKARYIEGTVAMRLGDYAGSAQLLEELASDAPDFELPLIALANLRQAQGTLALARELYERALDLVDGKLAAAEAELAGRTQFTAQEYGELRSSTTTLRSERSYILEQLAQLPNG